MNEEARAPLPDKSSMLYWYPKIKDLPIPQPKTEIVDIREFDPDWSYDWIDGKAGLPEALVSELKEVCQRIGYPVFLRTDHISGKHDWENTCFIKDEKALGRNLFGVIEASMMADLSINALVVREYIPMATLFTAFSGHMPVNPEIRFFVRDGKRDCWHWYWVENAIWNASVENWRKLLKTAEDEVKARWCDGIPRYKEASDVLGNYADSVAKVLDGYWSVDFCKAADGRWILIDCAEGDKSWHENDCLFNKGGKLWLSFASPVADRRRCAQKSWTQNSFPCG